MTKILVQHNQSASRTTSEDNAITRGVSFDTEYKEMVYNADGGAYYHFLSAEYLADDGAADIGLNSASFAETDVKSALEALDTYIDSVVNNTVTVDSTYDNIYGGDNAGVSLTTGTNNVFFGDSAGTNSTTSDNCTFIGKEAGYTNVIGDNCTFIGRQAGYSSTNNGNVGIGYNALWSVSTGTNNVALGNSAGFYVTGGNNTILGALAGNNAIPADTTTGAIMIGNRAGSNETNSATDILIIDNQARSVDSCNTDSIIYGVMNSTATNQTLALNAAVTINQAYTLPTTVGSANQVVLTNGSNAWSYATLNLAAIAAVSVGTAAQTFALDASSNCIFESSAGADILVIDGTNNNVGFGRAPETFGSGYTGLSVGGLGSIMALTSESAGAEFDLLTNAYWNGSAWKSIVADEACMILSQDGSYNFRVSDAALGGADSTITWKTSLLIKNNTVINCPNMPTSSAGLSSGDLWSDSGTIKIV